MCETIATAHQPYESSAVAQLDGERLDMRITTSAEIAYQLVGEQMGEAGALENLRAQLLSKGAELYEVTASGKRLQPERVFLNLRGGEVVISTIYTVARPAELRFQAVYLSKLPMGYGASIEVLDDAGNLLGRELRLKKGETKDTFSVHVPAAISNPVSMAVNSPAPAEEAAQSPMPIASVQTSIAPKQNAPFSLLIAIGAVLIFAVLIVRQFQRSRN